ncbi:DUF488 domain-containing protein [Streptomyces chilikensis]|uniref:DUF488 domain-containing protein n=1 Tax=Streptomyces chilikensis TaxID=1194079 RepID=UPI00140C9261|nr:DUF488 family protein [Streptomyces chilikensis]
MDRQITQHRVYDVSPDDGARILVDRIWPRGLGKEDARLDAWLREVAPTDALRRWYGHDPGRYAQFRGRYLAELEDDAHREAAERLRALADAGPVTLLTATRDPAVSHTAVLAEWLTGDGG